MNQDTIINDSIIIIIDQTLIQVNPLHNRKTIDSARLMFSFHSTGCKESQQHALAQKSLRHWTILLNKVLLDIHYLFNTRV